MLHDSGPAMWSRLLVLLLLCSLSSAILRRNITVMDPEEDGSAADPNTYRWSWESEQPLPSDVSALARNHHLHVGPPENHWPGGPNITDYKKMLGAVDPAMPPMPPPMPPDMLPDMSICDMLLNSAVPPTIDKIPVYCLCSNCKGMEGPKGAKGDRGPAGAPGSPGSRGMMGFKGRPGYTGPMGMKGQKGDMGDKGSPGSTGFTGMKGARGFKGEKGDRGMVGMEGAPGPKGETGMCPASCDSVSGPPGSQGPPGPAGARGLPGVQGPVGPKGSMGAKGDMGQPGTPGVDGAKGDQGEQGVCECQDGDPGSDGKPGEQGAKGAKGESGAQGVQGPLGPKGDKGDMGMTGVPGPCTPTIQSAFSVGINQSYPRHNHPIPFQHVISNQQGHFNPDLGIYTAPTNGTYVFSFHLAVGNKMLVVGLFHNRYPIIKTTEATSHSTLSQTVVLHLAMGDRVWLQVKNNVTNGMYTDKEMASTFSGYLQNPDSCEQWPGGRFHLPLMPMPEEEDYYSWDGPESTTPPPQ